MFIALALAVLASIAAGILFLLTTVFRTALLPQRLLFVPENRQKDYLVNLLVNTSFHRAKLDYQLKPFNKPRGRHQKLIERQTRIVTMLQEHGWWTTKTKNDVAQRVRELTDAWQHNVDRHYPAPV